MHEGKFRITDDLKRRFFEKVRKTNGCWKWTAAAHEAGYGIFWLASRKKLARATHVSWAIHHNEFVPSGKFICHHCDTPSCVNPTHLFVGDARENYIDMRAKGHFSPPPHHKGEKNGWAKLTKRDVHKIRRLASGEIRHHEIAKLIGVSRSCVSSVIGRKHWGHL